jgi:hypothetical protein
MKHIVHIIFFVAGAGLGIWWGVNHPSAAQNVANTEQDQASRVEDAVKKAKIELLDKLMNSDSAKQDQAAFKQMLSNEKQKLQSAATSVAN